MANLNYETNLEVLYTVFSCISYWQKRLELPKILYYYFPDDFDKSTAQLSLISDEIVDMVDCDEWVDLFGNHLDCLFAETGMDRELDFNCEDEQENEFFLWFDAFKDLVRLNNFYYAAIVMSVMPFLFFDS